MLLLLNKFKIIINNFWESNHVRLNIEHFYLSGYDSYFVMRFVSDKTNVHYPFLKNDKPEVMMSLSKYALIIHLL